MTGVAESVMPSCYSITFSAFPHFFSLSTGTTFSEPTLIGLAYAYEQGTLNRLPPGSTPPLPGEVFEYEPVPEPSTTIGLTVFGLTALGLKLKQRRKI